MWYSRLNKILFIYISTGIISVCTFLSLVTDSAWSQTDYRTFTLYDTELFSILYPPTWSIWAYHGASTDSGGEVGVTIARGAPNGSAPFTSPLIEVTVIPSMPCCGLDTWTALNKDLDATEFLIVIMSEI